MNMPFKKNDLILFTGDSITDGGRDRDSKLPKPTALGASYASLLAGQLGFEYAELNLSFCNTGIGGDRTCDLLNRWDADCIHLKPDWISILVGINNTWRRYDSDDPTSDVQFETELRELLSRIKNETPARIILCSPFLLHTDDLIARMREDLDPKIMIIKKLAAEFDAIWVDFDAAFSSEIPRQNPAYWAFDGVHPTIAGHALMAEAWLQAVRG